MTTLRRTGVAAAFGAGAAIVAIAVLAALIGPIVAPFDSAAQDLSQRLTGPSAQHWFGLDELGRDILSRVLEGARISLLVGLIVVSVSATVGIAVGAVAGYFGGVGTWAAIPFTARGGSLHSCGVRAVENDIFRFGLGHILISGYDYIRRSLWPPRLANALA